MAAPHDRRALSVLMTGSALRIGVAAVLVGVLWAAVAWALGGNAA